MQRRHGAHVAQLALRLAAQDGAQLVHLAGGGELGGNGAHVDDACDVFVHLRIQLLRGGGGAAARRHVQPCGGVKHGALHERQQLVGALRVHVYRAAAQVQRVAVQQEGNEVGERDANDVHKGQHLRRQHKGVVRLYHARHAACT